MNLQPRPKRNAKFFHEEKGVEVYLYHIRDQQTWIVSEDEKFEIVFEANPSVLSKVGKINGKSISKRVNVPTDAEKKAYSDLNSFFDDLADKIPFNCQCCGKPLYASTKKAKRSVCAHILPKAIFESVKLNPDNILFMGADFVGCPCNCHDRWDMNADIRVSMKIYDLAIKRFEKLKPFLSDKELIRAYTYLNVKWQ